MIAAAVLSISAFASSYDNISKELTSMGLYNDNYVGFSSSASPSRADAAAVLVDLLGKKSLAEAQYSAGKISCPFTDVSAKDAPYVAWLYEGKLVGGKSDTHFGSADPCNAQTYCTFALRALGYSEGAGGDFDYESAKDFAAQVGIYGPLLDYGDDNFTWFQMAAISYQTLLADPKSSSVTLLEKLISDGTVKESDAEVTLQKYRAYRALKKAEAAQTDLKSVDMTINFNLKKSGSTKYDSDGMYIKINSLKLISSDDPQMELVGVMQMDGETCFMSCWIKDSYIYMDIRGLAAEQKIKKALSQDFLTQILKIGSEPSANPLTASCPLYLVDSITFTKDATGAECSAIIPFENFYDIIKKGSGMALSNISGNITAKARFDMNGILSSVNAEIMASDSETSLSGKLEILIKATGRDVSITYPDFSDYVEYDSTVN